MICLDEWQATRTRVYALFDDTNDLHTFYQYLTRHSHRSCFDEIGSARLMMRDAITGLVRTFRYAAPRSR